MTEPGFGRLALWVAVVAGLGACVAGLAGRRVSGRLLVVAAVCGGVATTVLASALLDGDFSWAYVADNSRRHASAPYRLAALWGGMAGSLLVFSTLLAVVGCLAAWRARRFGPRTAATVAGLIGGVVAALGGLVLAFADPFERLELPEIDGRGLTPILEHPAMLYHPPLLYLGLVSLAAPAALTLAVAGRAGGVDVDEWAATVRRWLVVPWTLLAVGMVAGAHWAYVELGWGGYWAWDPVENTALLPWLAVTMSLHALVPGALGRWRHAAAALVCGGFVLALAGTMLTRSGAVPSVHAFGEDQAIGRGLAVLLGVVAVGAGVVLVRTSNFEATRPESGRFASKLREGRRPAAVGAAVSTDLAAEDRPSPVALPGADGPRGRQRWVVWLVVGHLVLVGGVLAITTIGTAWPLLRELTGGDDVAIEGRYFASFAGPLAAAALALLVLVPVVTTPLLRGSGPRRLQVAYVAAVAAGLVGGIGVLAAAGGELGIGSLVLGAAAGAALGAAIVGGIIATTPRNGQPAGSIATTSGTMRPAVDPAVMPASEIETPSRPRTRRVAAHVVHGGLALLLLGVAGTTTGATETLPLRAGQTVQVGGETVRFDGLEATEDGAGRPAVTALVDVADVRLRPSLVAYQQRGELLPETSLVSTPFRDVQVGLRDANVEGDSTDADAVATLQVGVYPLQVWVWWGALVIVAGGVVMLLPRRRPSRP